MVLAGNAARAGLLGSTLSWQYYAFGGAYTGTESAGTFVDNGSTGGTFIGGGNETYFDIIADNSSITFNYSDLNAGDGSWTTSDLSLAPTIHNGIAVNMVSGPAITSVTIDPATTMAGFDMSRISYTASQIQVDWQNLAYSPTTIVKLDINQVPEPSTFALLAAGCIGLFVYRRQMTGSKRSA